MKTTVYVPMFDDRPEPRWYFFYGTLTKPHILRHVIDLEEEPQFRPARIVGYELASLGQYPALIDNINGNEVTGHAYLVQTREQEAQLALYETDAYKEHYCIIKFTDEKDPVEVYGNTFMYAADAEALKEGRFDRKLWQIRMGYLLPVAWSDQKQRDSPKDTGGDRTDEHS
ncbi:hypothetical protein N3K66_005889 [Trichothecium roseum]|uniref:Uncharacterized protein n=1 Tax=Trichothecium roseum TaxID=47278 RepID=A0ACC0UZ56_9HYPO|nr:hypothetical protein N3K66_005889 [Trichothecium roseum]